MKSTKIPYAVIDHHSMWGWENPQITPEEADVIFVWNDFTMKENIKSWREQHKKVICFEHGWNAFFDYEYNKREMIADGYISIGYSSAGSMLQHGLDPKRILVTGNPNFDDLKNTKNKPVLVPRIVYTALHWTRDMTEYNNSKLKEIMDKLLPYTYISVKTIKKSKITIPTEVESWETEVNNNENLFTEIVNGLKNYDIILTPKESTFDFIALKMGKKVFRIGDEEEYSLKGDPKTRNILPLTAISSDILFKNHSIMVDIENELKESIQFSEILNWINHL
jgi:hypothetical protein